MSENSVPCIRKAMILPFRLKYIRVPTSRIEDSVLAPLAVEDFVQFTGCSPDTLYMRPTGRKPAGDRPPAERGR